jgi:hypothetical protein
MSTRNDKPTKSLMSQMYPKVDKKTPKGAVKKYNDQKQGTKRPMF